MRFTLSVQIVPGTGSAGHLSLAAEFSFGTDFAGDAGYFRSEGAELVHHRVHDLGCSEKFAGERSAFDFEGHGLGKIALGHGADDSRDFGGRLNEVGNERVNRLDTGAPGSRLPGKGRRAV